MIPHPKLSDEFFGNGLSTMRSRRAADPGLRERVTACRKRIRFSRAVHKVAPVCNPADEMFEQAESAASQPNRYSEEFSLSVAAGLIEEQEVGIT